jgi:predicted RNA binding protein YcfA (HicA-like mRNA interferase family)
MTSREKRLARLRALPPTMAYFEVEAICRDRGWQLRRIRGSHFYWVTQSGQVVEIVVHDKRVKRAYLRNMINAIETEAAHE